MSKRAATPFGEKKEPFVYGPWKFISEKSHILNSDEIERLAKKLDIPQLPEMTFGHNRLEIRHSSGFSIDFNAVAALELVNNKQDLMKVAVAEEWSESRNSMSMGNKLVQNKMAVFSSLGQASKFDIILGCDAVCSSSDALNDMFLCLAHCWKHAEGQNNDIVAETMKPFDWTFTTRYNGSINDDGQKVKVSETQERINIERLKTREKILFFEQMMLFEDELADNGCAQLTVKIRVMPSCFFILLRFFLRVDGVVSRIFDTRIYHEFGARYIIREYTEKEKKFSEMPNLPPTAMTDDNYMDKILKLQTQTVEKLEIPLEQSAEPETTNFESSPSANSAATSSSTPS